MNRRTFTSRAIPLLGVVCLFAVSFLLRGTATGRREVTGFEGTRGNSTSFAIADFDGDQKPDIASVNSERTDRQTTNYSIHFELSDGLQPAIGIRARTGGLQLFWRDVNGDHALDLVVRTSLDLNLVAVLLNDGHGKFTQADSGKFPGLEKEPEFYFGPEIRLSTEAFSSLPSRTTFGENGKQDTGARLPPVFESLGVQENQSYLGFLFDSGAGRSPPELS